MDYFLTDEQRALADRAYAFAKEKFTPLRRKYDATAEFPWEVVREMAKEGFLGSYLPREYGGAGGGVLDLVLVVEAFSRIDGSIALALAGTALGCYPILISGSDEQKARYLPPIASGEKLTMTNETKGVEIELVCALSDAERDILLAGGKLNLVKAQGKWRATDNLPH